MWSSRKRGIESAASLLSCCSCRCRYRWLNGRWIRPNKPGSANSFNNCHLMLEMEGIYHSLRTKRSLGFLLEKGGVGLGRLIYLST